MREGREGRSDREESAFYGPPDRIGRVRIYGQNRGGYQLSEGEKGKEGIYHPKGSSEDK